MSHCCFLEEGQLIKNAEKIKHIPTIMVNGCYVVICTPIIACRFHKNLPRSKLVIAEKAGHWMGEPSTEKALKSFE